MKNSILIVILLLLSFGCTQKPTEADKVSADAAVKGFYAAFEKFDYSSMRTFCTPDFHAIEGETILNSMDEFVAWLKTFEGYTFHAQMDIVKTDIVRDMAVILYKFDATLKKDKLEINMKGYESHTLKKVDGKWLIGFYQCSYTNAPPKLEKGSLLGIHIFSNIELKPGVTMEQAEDFMLNKYVPEFNLLSGDIKVIPLKGLRGENKDKLAVIMYLASDDVRNTLWKAEGSYTQKGQGLFNKLEPILKEEEKLFTIKKDQYTDWRVE